MDSDRVSFQIFQLSLYRLGIIWKGKTNHLCRKDSLYRLTSIALIPHKKYRLYRSCILLRSAIAGIFYPLFYIVAFLLYLRFYFMSSSAISSNSFRFSSLREDMIFTGFSSMVIFLLFSSIPVITFPAVDAQEPFSIRPIVRF